MKPSEPAIETRSALQPETPRATAAAMAREPELGKFIERRWAFGQNRYVCTGCNNYDSYDLRQVQEHVRLTHAAS